MRKPITVAILEADPMFRQQVRTQLESTGDIVIVGEAADEAELQEQMLSFPSLVLLAGLESLGRAQGVARLRARFPGIQVILLHDGAKEAQVLEALQQGARGDLVRAGLRPDALVEAVRTVARGEAFLSPAVAGRVVEEVAHRRGNRPLGTGAQEVADETERPIRVD
ncbi:MAG: hypothetical protein ACP5OO_08965 [Chloroflexia bacterium]